jgi:hypothetical protein
MWPSLVISNATNKCGFRQPAPLLLHLISSSLRMCNSRGFACPSCPCYCQQWWPLGMVRSKTWAASPQWEQMRQTPFVGGPSGGEPHVGCSIQYNALWQDGPNGSTYFAFWVWKKPLLPQSQAPILLLCSLAHECISVSSTGRVLLPCKPKHASAIMASVQARLDEHSLVANAMAGAAAI